MVSRQETELQLRNFIKSVTDDPDFKEIPGLTISKPWSDLSFYDEGYAKYPPQDKKAAAAYYSTVFKFLVFNEISDLSPAEMISYCVLYMLGDKSKSYLFEKAFGENVETSSIIAQLKVLSESDKKNLKTKLDKEAASTRPEDYHDADRDALQQLRSTRDSSNDTTENENKLIIMRGPFWVEVADLIMKADPEKWETFDEIRLIFGYYSMVLMRLVVKTKESVAKYLNDSALAVVTQIYSSQLKIKNTFEPPNPDSMVNLEQRMASNNETFHKMFNLICQTYLRNERVKDEENNILVKNDNRSTFVHSILSAGCLTHLSYNGLGIMNYFMEVCISYSATPEKLIPLLATDRTQDSCKKIQVFLKKYVYSGGVIWPWCRLIRQDYLFEYRLAAHRIVGTRLAGLIFYANQRNELATDIFSATYFLKMPGLEIEHAKAWARAAEKKLIPGLDSSEFGIDDAQEILTAATRERIDEDEDPIPALGRNLLDDDI